MSETHSARGEDTGERTYRLGSAAAWRFSRPGRHGRRPGPIALGRVAVAARRFVVGVARPVAVRRQLASAADIRPRQLEQVAGPPRWWIPQIYDETPDDSAPQPAPYSVDLPPRGLPRASRAIPTDSSTNPGGIAATMKGAPIRVRKIKEVTEVGSMPDAGDKLVPPTRRAAPGQHPRTAGDAPARATSPPGQRAGGGHAHRPDAGTAPQVTPAPRATAQPPVRTDLLRRAWLGTAATTASTSDGTTGASPTAAASIAPRATESPAMRRPRNVRRAVQPLPGPRRPQLRRHAPSSDIRPRAIPLSARPPAAAFAGAAHPGDEVPPTHEAPSTAVRPSNAPPRHQVPTDQPSAISPVASSQELPSVPPPVDSQQAALSPAETPNGAARLSAGWATDRPAPALDTSVSPPPSVSPTSLAATTANPVPETTRPGVLADQDREHGPVLMRAMSGPPRARIRAQAPAPLRPATAGLLATPGAAAPPGGPVRRLVGQSALPQAEHPRPGSDARQRTDRAGTSAHVRSSDQPGSSSQPAAARGLLTTPTPPSGPRSLPPATAPAAEPVPGAAEHATPQRFVSADGLAVVLRRMPARRSRAYGLAGGQPIPQGRIRDPQRPAAARSAAPIRPGMVSALIRETPRPPVSAAATATKGARIDARATAVPPHRGYGPALPAAMGPASATPLSRLLTTLPLRIQPSTRSAAQPGGQLEAAPVSPSSLIQASQPAAATPLAGQRSPDVASTHAGPPSRDIRPASATLLRSARVAPPRGVPVGPTQLAGGELLRRSPVKSIHSRPGAGAAAAGGAGAAGRPGPDDDLVGRLPAEMFERARDEARAGSPRALAGMSGAGGGGMLSSDGGSGAPSAVAAADQYRMSEDPTSGGRSIEQALTSREWEELIDEISRRLERRVADELSRRGRRFVPKSM